MTKKVSKDLIGSTITIGSAFDRDTDAAVRRYFVRLPSDWEQQAASVGITTKAAFAIYLVRQEDGVASREHPETSFDSLLRKSEAKQIGYLTFEVKSYYFQSRAGAKQAEQRLKFRPLASPPFRGKSYLRPLRAAEGETVFYAASGLPNGDPIIDLDGPFSEALDKADDYIPQQYSLGVSFKVDAVTGQGALSNVFSFVGNLNQTSARFYGVTFASGSLLFNSITMDQIRDGNLQYVGTYNFIFCPRSFNTHVLFDRSDNNSRLQIRTARGAPSTNFPIFPGTSSI